MVDNEPDPVCWPGQVSRGRKGVNTEPDPACAANKSLTAGKGSTVSLIQYAGPEKSFAAVKGSVFWMITLFSSFFLDCIILVGNFPGVPFPKKKPLRYSRVFTPRN